MSQEVIDALVAEMAATRPKKKKQRPTVVGEEELPPLKKRRKRNTVATKTSESAAGSVVAALAAARRCVSDRDADGAVEHSAQASKLAMQLRFKGGEEEEALVARRLCGQAAKTVSRRRTGVAAGGFAATTEALAALDGAYNRLRYLSLLLNDEIKAPHDYFRERVEEQDIDIASLVKKQKAVLKDVWELPEAGGPPTAEDNPLLALFHTRWRESCSLYSLEHEEEQLVPSAVSETMKQRDPVAPAAVHAWRASQRDWACHEYAYAVPTERALARIAELSPLLEVGAGTGYWAKLLLKRGADFIATDIRPPAKKQENAFHGRCRAWTDVKQVAGGVVEAIECHPNRTLFVCYAPPDPEDAFLGAAVDCFSGDTIALVGEWRGDTATAACLDRLTALFDCTELIPLPNWPDTSANLTIWRRKGSNKDVVQLDACQACGSMKTQRRCRLTCEVQCCSPACFRALKSRRDGLLELKFAKRFDSTTQPYAPFDSANHFAPIKITKKTATTTVASTTPAAAASTAKKSISTTRNNKKKKKQRAKKKNGANTA